MSTDTKLSTLIINKLSKEQYSQITPNANELYLVPEDFDPDDLADVAFSGDYNDLINKPEAKEDHAEVQYKPFSINNGVKNNDGYNNTLTTAGGTPSTVTVVRNVVPVMNSNSEQGVTVSISGANQNTTTPYKVTQSGSTIWYSAYGAGGIIIFTFALNEAIPSGASCSFTATGVSGYSTSLSVTFNYTDTTTETVWSTNSLGNNTVNPTVTASKAVSSISVRIVGNQASSAQTVCRTYLGNFNLTATYTESVSSADTLICNPCTITTADSKSKSFDGSVTYNINENPTTPTANYTVVGSPTISSDWIASGFDSSNYITFTDKIASITQAYMVECVATTGATNDGSIWGIMKSDYQNMIRVNANSANKLLFDVFANSGTVTRITTTNTIAFNTKYYIQAGQQANGTLFLRYKKVGDVNWIEDLTQAGTLINFDSVTLAKIGQSPHNLLEAFTGSVNLQDFKVYINGSLAYSALNQADGTYKVLKSYTDGSLSLASTLPIQKTAPTSPNADDLWLDNSQYPLAFKKYVAKNYTVVGSPTITADGIISNISNSDYVTIPSDFLTESAWKMVIPIPKGATGWGGLISRIGTSALQININSGTIAYSFSSDGSTWDIGSSSFAFSSLDNTKDAVFVLEFTGTSYIMSAIQNGATLTGTTITSSSKIYNSSQALVLGQNRGLNGATNGTIDLKDLKIYVNDTLIYTPTVPTGWVKNDNVYIGDVTVSSALITDVNNRYFNACPALRYIVDTYQNGASGYAIYSDGWCEQWGACTSGTAVVLEKSYKDTNYTLSITYSAKTATGFTPSATGDYIAKGFIE